MSKIGTFFSGIGEKLQKNFGGRHVEEKILSGIDLDMERLYHDPEAAIEIQNRYMDNVKRLDRLKPKYRQYVDYVALLERIEMLPSKVLKDLEKMCQIYSETLVQKSEFRDQIRSTEAAQNEYLEQYEESMSGIIKMMKDHEDNQRLVKQDMAYLESEKAELTYQSSRMATALTFVKHAFIVIAVVSALTALVLSIMFFINDQPILIPAMIAMVAVIAGTVWVYVFRRYLIHEMNKSNKLMKRTVELTNKTKIKYINNQKVLDFQYKKYKVDSSEMLELRWQNYRDKVTAKNQYRNISNSIAAMITDIEDLLAKNNIDDDGLVLDYLDYFVSKQGRKILMGKLNERRDELKADYEKTDKENNVINLVLTNYKSQIRD